VPPPGPALGRTGDPHRARPPLPRHRRRLANPYGRAPVTPRDDRRGEAPPTGARLARPRDRETANPAPHAQAPGHRHPPRQQPAHRAALAELMAPATRRFHRRYPLRSRGGPPDAPRSKAQSDDWRHSSTPPSLNPSPLADRPTEARTT